MSDGKHGKTAEGVSLREAKEGVAALGALEEHLRVVFHIPRRKGSDTL